MDPNWSDSSDLPAPPRSPPPVRPRTKRFRPLIREEGGEFRTDVLFEAALSLTRVPPLTMDSWSFSLNAQVQDWQRAPEGGPILTASRLDSTELLRPALHDSWSFSHFSVVAPRLPPPRHEPPPPVASSSCWTATATPPPALDIPSSSDERSTLGALDASERTDSVGYAELTPLSRTSRMRLLLPQLSPYHDNLRDRFQSLAKKSIEQLDCDKRMKKIESDIQEVEAKMALLTKPWEKRELLALRERLEKMHEHHRELAEGKSHAQLTQLIDSYEHQLNMARCHKKALMLQGSVSRSFYAERATVLPSGRASIARVGDTRGVLGSSADLQKHILDELEARVTGKAPPLRIAQQDMCEICHVPKVLVAHESQLACPKCGRGTRFISSMYNTFGGFERDEVQGSPQDVERMQQKLLNLQAKQTKEIPGPVLVSIANDLIARGVQRPEEVTLERVRDSISRLTRTLGKPFKGLLDHSNKIIFLLTGRKPPQMTAQQENRIISLLQLCRPLFDKAREEAGQKKAGNFKEYDIFIEAVCRNEGWNEFLPHIFTSKNSQKKNSVLIERVWRLAGLST
jgi:hypothetical protein